MKLTFIYLVFIFSLFGCAKDSYLVQANKTMQSPPRSETETLEQIKSREDASIALGTDINALSERDTYEAPKLIKSKYPKYPSQARQLKGGRVSVAISIDKNGVVELAKIISSTDPIFEKPAVDAVRKWRFLPAKINGKEARVSLTVPFRFKNELLGSWQ